MRVTRNSTLLFAALGPWLCVAVRAQSEPPTVAAIATQPLAQALTIFARQTGLQIVYVSGTVEGETSKGAPAGLTPRETLTRLLEGTGLTFEFLNERTVRIFVRSPTGSATPAVGSAPSLAASATTPALGVARSTSAQTDGAKEQAGGIRSMKGKGFLARVFAAFSVCGAAAHAGSACAQQAGVNSPGAESQLSEVVVTAQFISQNLQQTPLAITAISGNEANQLGARSLTDLTNVAPDVTFTPGGSVYPGAQMYIRGVGQDNFTPAEDPGVGVYLNDVYYGNIWGADFDLVDLDRVEILRGPQGTLAGVNSVGGAVKMYTKDATGDGDGYFEGGYGTDDTIEARGAYDASLVPDTLYLRVSGAVHRDNGYVTDFDFACLNPAEAGRLPKLNAVPGDCALGQAGGRDASVARADLRWQPSERLDINVVADVDDVTTQPSPEVLMAVNPAAIDPAWQAAMLADYGVQLDNRFVTGGTYTTYATYMNPQKDIILNPNGYTDSYGYDGTINYQLADDITLKSITAFRQMEGSDPEDGDASPLGANTGLFVLNHKQISEELRVTGTSFNKFLDWAAGVFYYDGDDLEEGLGNVDDAIYAIGGLYWYQHDTVTSLKEAAYANFTLHLTNPLSLNLGYRYSHSDEVYVFGRLDPDNPLDYPDDVTILGLNKLGPAPESVNVHSDYRAALEYQWTPDFMTYASIATGFKDGGVNPTPLTPAQAVPFVPETLTSYEIGLKSEWHDHRIMANLAGFYSNYRELQETALATVDGVLQSIFTNAGAATISGVEAEFQARPIRQLLLSASGSYLHFRYDYLGAAGLVADGPCLSCTQVLTPEYKASLSAQYQFNLGRGGLLAISLSDDYTAKEFADVTNNPVMELPQHWVADGRASWQLPNPAWQASLLVSNVFDKYYYVTVDNLWYGGAGTALGIPGRPREALLTLRYLFGTR